jgi:hypothetical protein
MPRRKLTQWFKDSRSSKTKIFQSRKSNHWGDLKSAILLLQQANKERMLGIKNGRRVEILRSHEDVNVIKEDGRYLIQPPLVGRDGVNLQSSLDERGYTAVVLCREPKTQLGLCPVVTLGDTTTVRVLVEESPRPERPTAKWFDFAINELGRTVVEKVDTLATFDRKLDYLLGHLGAIPAYDGLYVAIIEICDALMDTNE